MVLFCGSFVLFIYFICHAFMWSPEGKALTSWLLFVMFIVILFLSNLVSWDMCGTLIVSIPDPSCLSYFACTATNVSKHINI